MLEEVDIADGRPRTVSFVTNLAGEVLARNEADNNTAAGDPHERHYYFGGIAVGAISNNGTSNVDYAQSIAQHIAVPGTGAFRGGATAATSYADFDQSYDPINGLNVGTAPSRITVQQGDTLEAIAYQVWGDASYWYLLADANGLISDADLQAGMSLIVPDKVANSHNNSSTYRVYDPNEAQGNNSPTVPKPAARHGGACGVFGQILLAVIAVVVAVFLPPVGGVIAGGLESIGVGATTAGIIGGVAGAAVSAAAGSIVSQGVGLALGIQKSFDWDAVGLAALSAGVTRGLGASGAFDALGIGGDGIPEMFAQGALGNAATQGIAVATGLQKTFDWAGVAAAGVGAGIGGYVGGQIAGWQPFGAANGLLNQGARGLVSGMAGDIANAATRTLIDGSDFGDNIIAALPDVIGQTIGNAMMGDNNNNSASRPSPLDTNSDGDTFDIVRSSLKGAMDSSDMRGVVRVAALGNISLPQNAGPFGDLVINPTATIQGLSLDDSSAVNLSNEDLETVVVLGTRENPVARQSSPSSASWISGLINSITEGFTLEGKSQIEQGNGQIALARSIGSYWQAPSRFKMIDALPLSGGDPITMANTIEAFPETARPRAMSNGEVISNAVTVATTVLPAVSTLSAEALTAPRILAAEGASPFEEIMANVRTADFSSVPNRTIFYSGTGTYDAAETLAAEQGLTTISHTPGGSYLESLDLFGSDSPLSRAEADQVWAYASSRYANGASGDVLAVLNNPNPDRIYLSVERPILANNTNVNLREMTIPDLYVSTGNHH
ncbi:MAG: LysM peptidoglycan-binding domain-containing protein [Rhizomicrobium sp.]